MAEDLNSERSKDGARKMFEKAFGPTVAENWPKRKRYIRLTDAEVRKFDRDGEYVKTAACYVKLAEAYASLRFPGDLSAKSRALRLLVKGTALDPLSNIDLASMDGLTEAADQLMQIEHWLASDQKINKALEHLNHFPIAPFAPHDIDGGLRRGHVGSRILGSGFSIVPSNRSTLKLLSDFAASQDGPGYWFEARIFLGWLYRPRVISRLILPTSTQDFIDQVRKASQAANKKTAQKKAADAIYEIIGEALEEQGISDFWPGEELNDTNVEIPDKLKHTLYYAMKVFLVLSHNGAKPELALWITPQEEITDKTSAYLRPFNFEGDYSDTHIPKIYALGECADEDLLLSEGPGKVVYFDEQLGNLISLFEFIDSWNVNLLDIDGKVHVIGNFFWHGIEDWIQYVSASVNSETVREILGQGSSANGPVFRPGVWDDYSKVTQAPPGSIAATVLRNLAYAPIDQRIDNLLFADARKRLSGLPEFIDGELAKTHAALGNLIPGVEK